MSLQTNLTTRRQFLERSLWGFGSAFVLPSLLQSCMQDHIIPDPTNPPTTPIFPPELGLTIDWNDDAKTLVTSVIEMIPEAGDLLGGLVDILWPSSKEDVWGQIRGQVEALVDQKISDTVYQLVQEDLGSVDSTVPGGLIGVLDQYRNSLKTDTPAQILGNWSDTRKFFLAALPHFQSQGNELPLLPLFGQFVTLYLGLLRDGVIAGKSWGMTDSAHEDLKSDLTNNIPAFASYVTTQFTLGQALQMAKVGVNFHLCEPFRSTNAYNRQMAFTVLDFRDSWPYLDVTQYPNGTKALLTREIYSDPYGSCDDSGIIFISNQVPTQRPTNLTVWGYDRIDAVQLTYPANSGPNGVTTTPRMGDQPDGNGFGGSNQPPHGGIFTITPGNPIIAGRALTALYEYNGGLLGPLLAQLQFMYDSGTQTNLMGGTASVFNRDITDSGWIGYPYEALSSIHINGVNKPMQTADSIVFGFTFWKSPAAQLSTIQVLYVTSPKERTAADFAKHFPSLAIPGNLITDELKAKRKAHWEALEARVKGPK